MTSNPNPPIFRNMSELTTYLSTVEKRMINLEDENKKLRHELNRVIGDTRFKTERGLPNSGIVSHSFWTRAFTIWGHYFVAQLIISIPLVLCYLVFFFMMMSNLE